MLPACLLFVVVNLCISCWLAGFVVGFVRCVSVVGCVVVRLVLLFCCDFGVFVFCCDVIGSLCFVIVFFLCVSG